MMKSLLFKLFVVIASINLTSCAADRCNMVFFGGASIFNDEVERVNDAAIAYNDDPSTDNCNTYRERVREYIDELNSFRDCVTAQDLASFDSQIQGLEDQLALLNC